MMGGGLVRAMVARALVRAMVARALVRAMVASALVRAMVASDMVARVHLDPPLRTAGDGDRPGSLGASESLAARQGRRVSRLAGSPCRSMSRLSSSIRRLERS